MQSTYENLVEFNLSESGVRPLTPRELIEDPAGLDGLLDQPLVYSQSNGTIELRQRDRRDLSRRRHRSHRGHQRRLGSQLHHHLQPDRAGRRGRDARAELHADLGPVARVRRARFASGGSSRIAQAGRWRADLDALERAGVGAHQDDRHLQSEQPDRRAPDRRRARRRSRAIADRHGAWILSDEVYRGAELDGVETASMWGRSPNGDHHERVVEGVRASRACASAGSSAPPSLIASFWSYHDYVTIAPGALSDRLARVALQPERRAQLFERTRGILRAQPAADRSVAHRGRRLPLDQAGSRRDRLRALRPPDQFDDAGQPAARGEERADRAGRSLRDGRLPAPRLRRAARVQPRRPRSAARTAGVTARRTRCTRRARRSPPRHEPARADAGPDRLRQRRAALRPAARRDGRPSRLHLEDRRHLDAPSRQRRRSRRHRHAPRDHHRRRPPVARSPRSRAARAQRHRRDPPGRRRCWPTMRRKGRLVCIETTVLDIDRGEPAVAHVRAALEGQAHVVTANKGPAAFAYHELEALAESVDRVFFFEGAVMDGVPVFNLVRETMPAITIEGFRGVINTTCNFILSELERGSEFDARARRDAGARHRRSRSDARHRRLGRGREDRGAGQRADGQRHHAASRRAHRHSRRDRRSMCATRSAATSASAWWRRRRARAARSRRASNRRCSIASDPLAGLVDLNNALYLTTDLLGEVGIVQRGGSLTQTAYALLSDRVAHLTKAQRTLMAGPLSGFTVVDLTRVLSGPYCTMVLADLGARVIKVEQPGKGDDTRHWGPPFLGKESAYFLSINRNKESVTVDFKPAEGREVLERLIARADVFVENFRPGTIERAGFGWDAVHQRHPAPGLRVDLRLRTDRAAPRRSRLRRGDAGRGRIDERHRRSGSARLSARRRDHRHGGGPVLRAGHHRGAARARAIGTGPARRHRHARYDGGAAHLSGRELVRDRQDSAAPGQPPRDDRAVRDLHDRATARSSSPSATTRCGRSSARRSACRSWPPIRASRPTRIGWRTTTRCARRSIARFASKTNAEWVTILNDAGVANGEVRDIGQMLNDPQLAARDMVADADASHRRRHARDRRADQVFGERGERPHAAAGARTAHRRSARRDWL